MDKPVIPPKKKRGNHRHLSIADLTDFAGGHLPPEKQALVTEHLAHCPKCLAEYRFTSLLAKSFSPKVLEIDLDKALNDFWKGIDSHNAAVNPTDTTKKSYLHHK